MSHVLEVSVRAQKEKDFPLIIFQHGKESVYASHLSAPFTSTQPHPASMNLMSLTDVISLVFIRILSGNKVIRG